MIKKYKISDVAKFIIYKYEKHRKETGYKTLSVIYSGLWELAKNVTGIRDGKKLFEVLNAELIQRGYKIVPDKKMRLKLGKIDELERWNKSYLKLKNEFEQFMTKKHLDAKELYKKKMLKEHSSSEKKKKLATMDRETSVQEIKEEEDEEEIKKMILDAFSPPLLAKEIAAYYGYRSVICFDPDEFEFFVEHDSGDMHYRYTQDIRSPKIEIFVVTPDMKEPTKEDYYNFYDLLTNLEEDHQDLLRYEASCNFIWDLLAKKQYNIMEKAYKVWKTVQKWKKKF